jgi:hypothetical protein
MLMLMKESSGISAVKRLTQSSPNLSRKYRKTVTSRPVIKTVVTPPIAALVLFSR